MAERSQWAWDAENDRDTRAMLERLSGRDQTPYPDIPDQSMDGWEAFEDGSGRWHPGEVAAFQPYADDHRDASGY
jgi:hypothetical protein